MLELRDVSFHYGAVKAVNGLSMNVEEGSIHGLIGPNGAGKSTCVDLASGKLRPSSGDVLYQGQSISSRSAEWRRRAGIARSFQRISVFLSMTVAEQIHLIADILQDADVDAIVEALQIGPVLDRRCGEISYGEQRRVDVALALIGNPSLILLDEPAAGLSRDEGIQLADHLIDIVRARGATVVLIEHHLEVVYRVCETMTVMDLGTAIASGTPESIRSDPHVIKAYLGKAAQK